MRLADLLAGLSRLADIGFGLNAGEAVRSCVLATRLARSRDLPDEVVQAAYYTALLHHVGCTGYAHETALLFDDELAANTAAGRTNAAAPWDTFATFLPLLTGGRPPLTRVRLALTAFTRGRRWAMEYTVAACEVGREAARRLLLPVAVQHSLYHVYELWRGGGIPGGLAGEDIPVASRIVRLSGIAALFDSIGGPSMAAAAVRRRSGTMLDPQLATYFADRADKLLSELEVVDPKIAMLEAEPQPVVSVPPARLAEVASVFADLADMKSPYFHGHSRGVAARARGACEQLRLPSATVVDLETAGLLHDVGRVAISNAIWEKPGPLTTEEWEQIRLHPYHSERILAGSERLAPIAALVGRHHERLDGSGYHRGCVSTDLTISARVLAAADAYQALTEPRPHRPAMTPEQAEQRLLADARDGVLDADAVRAVLAAGGHRPVALRRALPAGLTGREVEVLALIAEGCSNAEIARRLIISPRTAEHHVQHIYTKIGVSSRAAATMFAMEHHLLPARDG